MKLPKQGILGRHGHKLLLWASLYALVLPTIVTLAIFSYYPKFDVVVMSTFRWEPPFVQEFIGLENFREAFSDPLFKDSFRLVGIILVANLIKLWPGIFAAIALHRLRNDRLRYVFQVAFVVPMIVPAMVWLLVWKNLYDPDFGLFNRILNASGLMGLLDDLDRFMPVLAMQLQELFTLTINPVLGTPAALILIGVYALALRGLAEEALTTPAEGETGSRTRTLLRLLRRDWIIWAILLGAGLLVHAGEAWRLFLDLFVALAIWALLRSRRDAFTVRNDIKWIATGTILAGSLLILLSYVWTRPTGQFSLGNPAWLGAQDLVIPAILFWGFPWVGAVGVLIYLSGLQNISNDIYEAARLDGVGPWQMIFKIELPLILTQVRINLIFMTIGTLTGYEMFLILLGPEGGPGNRGMVPGLYMFSSAFAEGRFGYASALGMILFVVILTLTIIYQRYVRVEK